MSHRGARTAAVRWSNRLFATLSSRSRNLVCSASVERLVWVVEQSFEDQPGQRTLPSTSKELKVFNAKDDEHQWTYNL